MKKTLIAATLATCGLAAHAQISGDVVKIGFLTDMSSVYADIDGAGGVEAIKMAIADMKGMAAGKKVEIIFADHQNKADVGSQIARYPRRTVSSATRKSLARSVGHGAQSSRRTAKSEPERPISVVASLSRRRSAISKRT